MQTELAKALVAAQAEFPAIARNCTAKVTMKAGGTYTFDYADLPSVLAAVKPVLQRHGLTMLHCVVSHDGINWLRSKLLHASGESIEAEVAIPFDGARIQELGSAITYMRRYQTLAMLDICADDDDDANAADGNKAEIDRREPKRQEQPKPKPASNLPEGADRITECKATKAKNGSEYWRITSERGVKATTFSAHLAQIAEEYANHAVLCTLTTEPGKGGWLSLKDVTMFAKPAEPANKKAQIQKSKVSIKRVAPELLNGTEVWHAVIDGWSVPLSTTEADLAEEMKAVVEMQEECEVAWIETPKGGRRLCKVTRLEQAA